MQELKPCPFCGGEAETSRGLHNYDMWGIWCPECKIAVSALYSSEQDAVAAWNRRAERTCRVEVERRKLSQTQTAVVKTCSGCGFEFGVEKENTLPFEVTLNAVVPPNYCPNCGARVIKEES